MIDNARITELEHEIGADDLALILDMFLSEAGQAIDHIATGLDDLEHARAIHFLRSGALNIGLTGLAQEAEAAAAVDPGARAAAAAGLMATLRQSVTLLALPVRTA